RFVLDGIQPAPRGIPQIEVAFDIDANGILHVSATDKATGKAQRVEVQPSSGLAESEIQRMIRDAEQHAAEDARLREEADLKNRADNLAYTAERLLREQGTQLPSDVKLQVEEQVQAVRRALDSNDILALRRAMDDLERTMQRAGDAVYSSSGAGTPSGGSGGGTGGPGSPPGTVEGEFREV